MKYWCLQLYTGRLDAKPSIIGTCFFCLSTRPERGWKTGRRPPDRSRRPGRCRWDAHTMTGHLRRGPGGGELWVTRCLNQDHVHGGGAYLVFHTLLEDVSTGTGPARANAWRGQGMSE